MCSVLALSSELKWKRHQGLGFIKLEAIMSLFLWLSYEVIKKYLSPMSL